MPEYTVHHGDIMVKFQGLGKNPQAIPQAPQEQERTIQDRILAVIRGNPCTSQTQIAVVLGEDYETVKYQMKLMKKAGILTREGTSQKGKWVITKKA